MRIRAKGYFIQNNNVGIYTYIILPFTKRSSIQLRYAGATGHFLQAQKYFTLTASGGSYGSGEL